MAKLQCPNCGGYKSEKLGTISRFLGKIFSYGCLLIGAYILGIVASSFLKGNIEVLFFVMAIAVVCCLWDFFTTFQPGKVSCLLCGFKWRKSDYPNSTTFKVQPHLIEKGNIRLEQERLERERRRKREEEQKRQNEGYYYNQNK